MCICVPLSCVACRSEFTSDYSLLLATVVMVKIKFCGSPSCYSGRNAADPQAAAVDSGSREQPVPGRDSTVPQVAAAGHESQAGAIWWVRVSRGKTDRRAHHKTIVQVSEGGWSQAGSHSVGETQTDRCSIQSEAGYLFSRL